jgi:hypothetical protein
MESSTVSACEIPAVNSAVEHLSDLAERMRHDYDVENGVTDEIKSLISAIKEMVGFTRASQYGAPWDSEPNLITCFGDGLC